VYRQIGSFSQPMAAPYRATGEPAGGTPAARTNGRRNPGQVTVAATGRIRCRVPGPKYT
jgi:hypothetical protein